MKINSLNSNQSFKGTFTYENKKDTARQIAKLSGTSADELVQPTTDGINSIKKAVELETPDSFECSLDANIYGKIGSQTCFSYDCSSIYRDFFIDKFLRLRLKCKKDKNSETKTVEYKIRLTNNNITSNPKNISSKFSDIINGTIDYANSTQNIGISKFNASQHSIYNKLDD